MPASHGLRSRPSASPIRAGVANFVSSQGFVDAVPRAVLFPLLALASFAVISATVWVHDMYQADQVAEIDTPQTTGTVQVR
jgi:hypothetical protein